MKTLLKSCLNVIKSRFIYDAISPNKLFRGSKTGKMQHLRRWNFFCLQCRSSINPSFLQIWMQNLAPFMSEGDFSAQKCERKLNLQVADKQYWIKAILCFWCSFNCLEVIHTSKLPFRSLFRSQTARSFFIEKKES